MKLIVDIVIDFVLVVGLNGLVDWSMVQFFLDYFKMVCLWSGRCGDMFGVVSFVQLQVVGVIDVFGWLWVVLYGLDGVSIVLLIDLDYCVCDLVGCYIVVWEGEGEVELIGGQNVEWCKNCFDFDFDFVLGCLLEFWVWCVDVGLICDICIVQQDNICCYNLGNIFCVEWLDVI